MLRTLFLPPPSPTGTGSCCVHCLHGTPCRTHLGLPGFCPWTAPRAAISPAPGLAAPAAWLAQFLCPVLSPVLRARLLHARAAWTLPWISRPGRLRYRTQDSAELCAAFRTCAQFADPCAAHTGFCAFSAPPGLRLGFCRFCLYAGPPRRSLRSSATSFATVAPILRLWTRCTVTFSACVRSADLRLDAIYSATWTPDITAVAGPAPHWLPTGHAPHAPPRFGLPQDCACPPPTAGPGFWYMQTLPTAHCSPAPCWTAAFSSCMVAHLRIRHRAPHCNAHAAAGTAGLCLFDSATSACMRRRACGRFTRCWTVTAPQKVLRQQRILRMRAFSLCCRTALVLSLPLLPLAAVTGRT